MQRDNSPLEPEPVMDEPKRKSCVPKRIPEGYYWASWTNDHEGDGRMFVAYYRGYWQLMGTNRVYQEHLIKPIATVDRP